ncbi:transposase [Streptomyces sp. G7(2002)]|nr:hypothetical protein [Streptomyces sp. G7(2002)]WDT53118.1 transposase [Streptomyces sp. G7(2002)]
MKKPGRPPKWTTRQLVDGMRWRTRAGVPWGMCPSGTAPGRPCTGRSAVGSGTARGSGSLRTCRPTRTRRD